VALACSPILPLLPCRPLLREAFPHLLGEAGSTTGLPRSADVPEEVRSRLYAGGSTSAPEEFGASGPGHVPFWPKRDSSLRLFSCDDAYDASPGLTLTTPSWFPTALLLAVAVTARAWAALHKGGGYVVPGLLIPVGYRWQNSGCLSVGPPTSAQLHRRPRVAPERPSSPAAAAGETLKPENATGRRRQYLIGCRPSAG
jgi:hypothetical protein